jgi:cytochrome c biogenesis protein ResB
MVRRRRFFVRAEPADDGSTEVMLGGLARSDAAGGFESEFSGLTDVLRELHAGEVQSAGADPALASQEGSEQ